MPFEHLVVLMLENRSFDNMLGAAYKRTDVPPVTTLNPDQLYYGLDFDLTGRPKTANSTDYSNPGPTGSVPIKPATDFRMPHPDPGEHFDRITKQIFGNRPVAPGNNDMSGFLLDFAQSAGTAGAAVIMHYYPPEQVPVITALAREFAVCDRWFASSPTQTLPNRSFVHAGTSNGKVNNSPYNPIDFNVRTIFNVLETKNISWAVYKDTRLHGLDRFCGTRVQFPQLWTVPDSKFKHLENFHADVASGNLPSYSFLEPRLLIDGNDEHPSRDIRLGEELIYDIYESVRRSPRPQDILFVITYDEHGGCYDHVPPPFGATPPGVSDKPNECDFAFDRFGVRVPAIVVSPYIEKGTVFRSTPGPTEIPFDHTSILATLRAWRGIDDASMLPSARVRRAPTLLNISTRPTPREMPEIPQPHEIPKIERLLDFGDEANDLQIALAMGLTSWADSLHGTRSARDPALPGKLKSRTLLTVHVIEEVARIKAKKQAPAR
jgi:phospholipase C